MNAKLEIPRDLAEVVLVDIKMKKSAGTGSLFSIREIEPSKALPVEELIHCQRIQFAS